MTLARVTVLALLATLIFYCVVVVCLADTLTASWYSVESCRREGTSGICANGERLDDEKLTCASWDYPFGTLLKITNLANGKVIVVTVTDRGPNRKLYRQGRVVDLSKRAMRELDGIKRGIIPIAVVRVKEAK